jgi:hypothetical protein
MVARWSAVPGMAGVLGSLSPAWGDIVTRFGTLFKRPDLMKNMRVCVLAPLVTFALPSVAMADSIVVSVGNTAPTNPFAGGAPLVSGNTYGSAVISSGFSCPATAFAAPAVQGLGLDYPFTVPGFGSGCQVLPV